MEQTNRIIHEKSYVMYCLVIIFCTFFVKLFNEISNEQMNERRKTREPENVIKENTRKLLSPFQRFPFFFRVE